ncbi:transmembrane sensor/regulator PpyR [Zestomonas carbonaria]|uniref:Transmembrane sensor/regulator PpyR n=1 Tax=Zestomonas carbonaria TaxID=2762745 RepID=A0A7U7EPD0_9GAMM|nr:transmembrane sensor/regulator PpyR [Pseudomonas carbonaria]CAD5108616.1 hypothetical protein PSEWESI4_02908 [Pseudomonas carbonaria]
MSDLFGCPVHVLRLSGYLLAVGTALLIVGVTAAYGFDRALSIPQQVLAHSGVILGPTLLKVGYVMRLLAQHNLRKLNGEVCCAIA